MNNLIRLKDLQVFYNSLNLELYKLNHIRQKFNPTQFLSNIEKAYHKKNILEFTSQVSCYLFYSFIFYFYPFWLIVLFIQEKQSVRDRKALILSLKQINFLINEYRRQTKILLLSTSKNTINFEITICLLPFVIGFCHMIWSRYKDQSFSIFIQTNVPGICTPYQKLSWQTFKYIKSNQLTLNTSRDSWDLVPTSNQLINVSNGTEKLQPSINKNLNLGNLNFLLPVINRMLNNLSQNERVDFYNDYILINSELMKNNHTIDSNFGVFKGVAKTNLVDSKNPKFQWYQISAHDFISFFPLLKNSQFNFVDTNISAQNWFQQILKNENSDKLIVSTSSDLGSFNQNTIQNKNQNKRQKNFDFQKKQNTKSTNFLLNSLLLAWKTFYYNLDELPKKLHTNFPHLKQKSILVAQTEVSNKKPERRIPERERNGVDKTILLKETSEIRWPAPINAGYQSQAKEKFNFFVSKTKIANSHQQSQRPLNNYSSSNFIVFKKIKQLPVSIAITSFDKISHNESETSQKVKLQNQVEIISNQLKFLNNFYKKSQLLNNELKTLFYTQGLKPLNSIKKLSKKQHLKIKNTDTKYSQKNVNNEIQFLTSIDDTIISEKNLLIQPRLMSGYAFPDMTVQEVEFLNIKFLHRHSFYLLFKSFFNFENSKKSIFRSLTANSLKIELPPSCSSSVKYNFPSLKIPLLTWQYHKLLFKVQGSEIFPYYNSIEKDKVVNNSQVQKWSNQFFSPDNPITDRQQHFFGINENQKTFLDFPQEHKSPFGILEKNEQNLISNSTIKASNSSVSLSILENKNDLIDEISKKSPPDFLSQYVFLGDLPIITSSDQLKVPFLNKQESKFVVEQIKNQLKFSPNKPSKDKSENIEMPIDLMIVRQPLEKPIIWPLTSIDYQPVNSFNVAFQEAGKLKTQALTKKQERLANRLHSSVQQSNKISPKIIFHYTPYSQILLNQCLPETNKVSGIYQKIFSNTIFHEAWEPPTSKSWLIVTEIIFGLVVLKIFEEFYDYYGKEAVSFCLEAVGMADETLLMELGLDESEKGFRIIKRIEKTFQDVVGIDNILRELGEIVWFLRSYSQFFKPAKAKIAPKGILLTGPPGTGKTLLVQAIAGEAEVPILVQSGSTLDHDNLGAERLINLFKKARQLAPCIIFIDEIDTFGEQRKNVIPFQSAALQPTKYDDNESSFIPKPELEDDDDDDNVSNVSIQYQADVQKKKNLRLLTQFLIEMDGLKSSNGVIVFGATNRPNILDPALTRPGRFEEVLPLELPGKQKRIEILKFYSQNLGINLTASPGESDHQTRSSAFFGKSKVDSTLNVAWNYLANRTIGLSAADLAAVMNESSMRAIIDHTTHSIQTIEHGITRITTYNLEKPTNKLKNYKDPFFVSRLAYYQAGKAVLYTLLKKHVPAVVLELWPQPKNTRYISEEDFLKMNLRSEFETRLIGLYAGKAAELLVLAENSYWYSDLGLDELSYATSLAQSMIDKYFFYSKTIAIRKINGIELNKNSEEIPENEIYTYLDELAEQKEQEMSQELDPNLGQQQNWLVRPWWQNELAKQTEFLNRFYKIWYRIYLPDPEQSELNEEWVPPDKYFHKTDSLKVVSKASPSTKASSSRKSFSATWNDLYKFDRDYIYHGLILNCFNKAFCILNDNREILDYFADYLIRNEILREYEISAIFSDFGYSINLKISESTDSPSSVSELLTNEIFDSSQQSELNLKPKHAPSFDPSCHTRVTNQNPNADQQRKQLSEKIILSKTWGQNSRRKNSRFLSFDNLKKIKPL
uniref:Cell division protein n=1 Tax=Parietochloris pseudoalveolaris TaxID=3102 RepID=A0A097KLN6_9CHLO|nr:cell division protein [Parietochloris pseudoalveolaris]AIT94099.1 cell division protein [Parietochloris pseudoalveolaris]